MTTTFADLFERAAEYDVSAEAVNAALVERRSASGDDSGTTTEVASDVSDTDDLPRRPRSESGPCRRRRRCARSRPPRRRAGSRGARRATLARVDDFGRQRPAPRRRRGRGRLARGRRAGGRLARSSRGVARASGATRGRPPGAGVGVPRRSDAGREPRSVAYGSAGRGRTPKSDAGERSGAARVRDRVLASEAVSGGRRGSTRVPTATRARWNRSISARTGTPARTSIDKPPPTGPRVMTDSDATAVAGPASTATPPSCRPISMRSAMHSSTGTRRTTASSRGDAQRTPTRSSSAR